MEQHKNREKSNKKFMVLSAIGIFMVVDHHTFTAFKVFGNVIPYNSFFMPMFVFVSGYFNKVDSSTNLRTYLIKKIKSLIIPYVGISLLAFVLQFLMSWFKGGEVPSYSLEYLAYMLERVVTVGSAFSLVEPMWFVITLFTLLIVYALLKKVLDKIWNNFVAFTIFSIFSFIVVFLAHNNLLISKSYLLLPMKVLFFLPFIELGVIYRKYLEKIHSGLSGTWKIAILMTLIGINVIRTIYLPDSYDIAFDSLNELTGFTSPFFVTPMVSSLVGILFWLTFVDLIGKPVYESRFVNYMSCNTFWIMGLHIVFFNLINCILLLISEHIAYIPYFDIEEFRGTEWYYWGISDNIKMLYVFVGILGPLWLKWIFDRLTCLKKEKRSAH